MKIPDDHPFAKWALWQFGENWQDKILPRDIEEWDAAVGACADFIKGREDEHGVVVDIGELMRKTMLRDCGLEATKGEGKG